MKLSAVMLATVAIQGDWIGPGDEYDDLEFRVVPFNDAYTDSQARAHRRLAQAYGGNLDAVPVALKRKANLDSLLKHCVFDVRNLQGADGEPVTFEQVSAMVYDEQYRPLSLAMFAAVAIASGRRAADLEEAVGNSGMPSASAASGAATTPG